MEKAKTRNSPFAKLYIWIRNFDVYKGNNPFKRLLHHIACRMWDFQDDRELDMYFLNKRKTQINYISFPRYLFMSLFYKTEHTSQWWGGLGLYVPTKDLTKGLVVQVVIYNTDDARAKPKLYLFPYKHKVREGFDNNYDLIGRIELTEKKPESIDDIVPVKGYEIPLAYKKAILEWANEKDKWEIAKYAWESGKKNFIHDVDVKTITNEKIIELFPSKAERDYLTKINWQFSARDREILYRYLALNEEPAYKDDYVTIPFPFRNGDLVKVIGEEERIGVFCSCKDDKNFFDLDARTKDFSDWTDAGSTRVEFLEPDGRFCHEHPYAYNLEYAELPKDADNKTSRTVKDNPYKCALEIASELIRNTDSSIESLQMYCEEYEKKK